MGINELNALSYKSNCCTEWMNLKKSNITADVNRNEKIFRGAAHQTIDIKCINVCNCAWLPVARGTAGRICEAVVISLGPRSDSKLTD